MFAIYTRQLFKDMVEYKRNLGEICAHAHFHSRAELIIRGSLDMLSLFELSERGVVLQRKWRKRF